MKQMIAAKKYETIPASLLTLFRRDIGVIRKTAILFNDFKDDDIVFTDRHKSEPGNTDDDKPHMTIKYTSDGSVTHVYDDYSSRTWDKYGNEEK